MVEVSGIREFTLVQKVQAEFADLKIRGLRQNYRPKTSELHDSVYKKKRGEAGWSSPLLNPPILEFSYNNPNI